MRTKNRFTLQEPHIFHLQNESTLKHFYFNILHVISGNMCSLYAHLKIERQENKETAEFWMEKNVLLTVVHRKTDRNLEIRF